FTINAMLFDPFSAEILDFFGGRRDLGARVLRAVDPSRFGEDPLRALRAVQLASRYELSVEPETARLCASMPLAELPADRVFGEIEKLLLKSSRPSLGLRLLREWGLLAQVAPELIPLADTPQDPKWHPEGDVWTHTLLAIDQAVPLVADLDRPRALTVMLATLYDDRERVSDGAIRRLAAKCEPGLLYRVARADCLGRTGDFPPVAMEWFLDRVRRLDVAERPPAPLLRGRDVVALGVAPGPEVGRVVREVYERQLDGAVNSADEARAEARKLIAVSRGGSGS